MCPVCPGFLPLLAPCLLGGRMLGPGWLVQFGSIGLDQSEEPVQSPFRGRVTQRDSRRQTVPRQMRHPLSGSPQSWTQPAQRNRPHGPDLPIIAGCVLQVHGIAGSGAAPPAVIATAAIRGPLKVRARYIWALTWHYPAREEGRRPGQRKPAQGWPSSGP